MTPDRTMALSALSDIETAEHRTFQALAYGISSRILILWGGITVIGYLITQFQPRTALWSWGVLDVLGFLATAAMLRGSARRMTAKQAAQTWRLFSAQVVLTVFGLLVVWLLGPLSGRQLGALWPLVIMLGYVLAGLWVGRFFVVCGVAVTILTLAGYHWSGPWFPLWMAAANGGALVLGGLWLRRVGASL